MADSKGEKMTKHEKKALKKLHKVQQTLLRHNNIPSSSVPTPHLVIGNGGLGNDVDRESIESTFSAHGSICDIVMLPQKPYCFVTFSSTEDADQAREALHGKPMPSNPNVVLYITFVEKVPGMALPSSVLPPGLLLIEDYVTEEEEEKLLAAVDWSTVDTDATSCLKHRRVKHYGYEFIYGLNNVTPDNPLDEKIPQECSAILQDLVDRGVFPTQPDQLTVNQYQPGQGIPPHIDTHSAFDGAIVSLSLGSQAVMEFVDPHGKESAVLLPQRSVVVMDGEARYAWTHAITPRKSDIVAKTYEEGDKLTLVKRGVRTSFTFRLVRRGPCVCNYPEHCDSQQDSNKPSEKPDSKAALPKSVEEAMKLEETHVHQVYEEIASHFSATRHTQWPLVADFLKSRPEGALIADVGCGNGKYLPSHNNSINIGCDRSKALCEISAQRGFLVFACDCLAVPLRDGIFDAAVCIAVIHHLSTAERRKLAVEQLSKLLCPGGKALISVWALEQERNKENSNYIKESKLPTADAEKETTSNVEDMSKDTTKEELNVHTNRTHFKDQDMLVPWHLRSKEKSKEAQKEAKDTAPVYHRYYHLFTEGELEILCNSVQGIRTVNSYYDKGNWCVIFEKE